MLLVLYISGASLVVSVLVILLSDHIDAIDDFIEWASPWNIFCWFLISFAVALFSLTYVAVTSRYAGRIDACMHAFPDKTREWCKLFVTASGQ